MVRSYMYNVHDYERVLLATFRLSNQMGRLLETMIMHTLLIGQHKQCQMFNAAVDRQLVKYLRFGYLYVHVITPVYYTVARCNGS